MSTPRRPPRFWWVAFLGFTSGPIVTLVGNVWQGQLVTSGTGLVVCAWALADMDRVMPNPGDDRAIAQNRRWLKTALTLAVVPLAVLFVASALFVVSA